MQMTLTKIFKFHAAHYLNNPNKSQRWNFRTYRKCSHLHGHTFTLEVTVKGYPNRETGFIINFVDLKKIVNSSVISKLDHALLNNFCSIPTCENLIRFIWDTLQEELQKKNLRLHKLKLYETESSYVQLCEEET